MVDIKYRKIAGAIILFLVVNALVGCKLQKTDETFRQKDDKVSLIDIKQRDYDINQIMLRYLNMAMKDASEYDVSEDSERFQIQYKGRELVISPLDEGDISETVFVYYDHNENVGPAYESLLYQEGVYESFTEYYHLSLIDYFNEEEIGECSKDDVISFCRPYAEALGYGSANVLCVAMDYDSLKDASTMSGLWSVNGLEKSDRIYHGAPDPDCKLSYREEDISEREPLPWRQKDEAYLMIYQPVFDQNIVDCGTQQLHMVYVPAREKIVYAYGVLLFDYAWSDKKEDIITSESAVKKVMLDNGISGKSDIEVLDKNIVYSADYEQFHVDGILYPYWRIDFKNNRNGNSIFTETVLVNAIDGMIYDND